MTPQFAPSLTGDLTPSKVLYAILILRQLLLTHWRDEVRLRLHRTALIAIALATASSVAPCLMCVAGNVASLLVVLLRLVLLLLRLLLLAIFIDFHRDAVACAYFEACRDESHFLVWVGEWWWVCVCF